MGKTRFKNLKFDTGILSLLLVVIGLPLTYFAATNKSGLTTNSQHAYYCGWTEITSAFNQNVGGGLGNIYIHLYEKEDLRGNFCGSFKTHVDLYADANTGGYVEDGLCNQQLSCVGVTPNPTVPWSSSGRWVGHGWDSPELASPCVMGAGTYFVQTGRGLQYVKVQTNNNNWYCAH